MRRTFAALVLAGSALLAQPAQAVPPPCLVEVRTYTITVYTVVANLTVHSRYVCVG